MLKIPLHLQFKYFLKGLTQAFNWTFVCKQFATSKSIQQTLIKSLALNGVAYLGLLVFIETFYNTPDHHLYGYSYRDLTGYPLYLICLVINSKLYRQFSQATMTPLQQDAAATRDSSASLSSTISTIILYANFVLYINLLRRVPLIGSTVSFLNYCIIMAYYCFEYTWINQDWSIEQRMTYAEEHWAYCLGFGLPASALTFFLSTLRSNGVFALLFPSYIMMASVGVPEPASSLLKKEIPFVANPSALPHKIPVFLGVRLLNQFIIRFIGILFGSRGVGSKNRYNSFDSDRSKINLNKIV